ncbi:hypothetical protein SELMODRAFT_421858 [Selaginella moellendorffii]|uniref:PHD-type domain-containing protein n=1 Tax=Selaginella moellendorffii TaxID=88036 RepID=D8SGK6_SELML|nr:hypothetical protein SELMODRAFT_421858 [Selaginella moellendorffii]
MSAELGPDELESLQSWWSYVWSLKREDIAAGKVIKMFNPISVSADKRLSSLYICSESGFSANDWICHINGNSGVGKSAFLWYFIIRTAIELRDSKVKLELHILYESAGFVWEFKGTAVRVAKRDSFTAATFAKASWHLINQKVPTDGAIGPVVLLAASPAEENVKAAKPDRKKTVMYMYPWEEDEYAALVDLWRIHYEKLASELETLKKTLRSLEKWANMEYDFGASIMLAGPADLAKVPAVKERVEKMLQKHVETQSETATGLAFDLKVLIQAFEQQVQDGFERVRAAPEYYKWFGGVVRLLWSDDFQRLNPEEFVRDSLSRTDLGQLLECLKQKAQGQKISRALLHFRKPAASSSFREYYLDFCSVKVQAQFTLALTRMKAIDLEFFMRTWSDIPKYGVLRGFVFEELSIAYVLHGATHTVVLMVGDKHCSKCKSREDPSRGKYRGKWIACDVCQQCYHFSCTRVTKKQELEVFWQCSSCKSMKREEHLEPRRLLRYYEGDLKAALLEAGADAIQYVWRPLIKNDGAVDYTILPRTLAQPTVAPRHPVSTEALKTHIGALRAWNDIYGGTSKPDEFVLCFFLAESNYDGFGFQSYRDKSRRVTKQAVKGIRQCKVLLRYTAPVPCAEEMEIPKGVEMVNDIEGCKFDGEVCKPNYFDPVEDVLRYEEIVRKSGCRYKDHIFN